MKKIILIILIISSLFAGDFERATQLYESKKYKEAFVILKKLSNEGNKESSILLAGMYINALGVKKDENKAYKIYKKYANKDDALSQAMVGFALMGGTLGTEKLNIKKDANLGLKYLKKSGHQNFMIAQKFLPKVYLKGLNGIDRDITKGLYWLKKAYKNGDDESGLQYAAIMLSNYTGFKKNRKEAIEILKKLSNIKATVLLGEVYEDGKGVKIDYKKAIYYYKLGANKGLALAEFKLGAMYQDGRGTLKDYSKALYWYKKASSQDFLSAKANLAVMYANGYGIRKDLKKAINLSREASKENIVAQCNMAQFMINDNNSVSTKRKAKKLVKEAYDKTNNSYCKSVWDGNKLYSY